MPTQCASCGSGTPEGAVVCATCGWDPVARKHVGKPAGLDLFFRPEPSAPQPVIEEPVTLPATAAASPPPLDLAPPPAPEGKPEAEPPMPTGYPSNILNPVLQALKNTEGGRAALLNPEVQLVVAALRKPPVFSAVAAAFGLWALTTLYFLWPEPPPVKPRAAAPAPPEEYVRPVATLAPTPRVLVNTLDMVHPAGSESTPAGSPASAAAPASAPEPDLAEGDDDASAAAEPKAASKPKPSWAFKGTVYDLITMRTVYAAKLVFTDARGRVAGRTTSDTKGRYKISLPAASGYTLKITHSDYQGYVDVINAKSLRETTFEDRQVLSKAASHAAAWIGRTGAVVPRDVALLPRPE